MFNRIWKKLTIAFMLVALTPIAYFGYQDLQAAKSSIVDEALKEIFLNSVTRSKEIERAFINAHMDIRYLRSIFSVQFLLEAVRDKPEEAGFWKSLVEKEFIRFLSVRRGYSRIGLLDDYGNETLVVFRNGNQIVSLGDMHRRNRLTSSYYVEAAQQGRYGVTAIPMTNIVHPGHDLRRITLVRYATKALDQDSGALGVIYLDLNGSEIYEGLSQTSLERKRSAALVTSKGNFIFNPYVNTGLDAARMKPYSDMRVSYPKAVVSQILSGRSGIISDDPDNLFAYSAVYPEPADKSRFYAVFDVYPKRLFSEKLYEIKKKYILAALGAFGFVIIVAVILSRALTRPINKLIDGVERAGRRELDHRIDIKSGDEIESLAKAYNMMADSLKEYSETLEKKVEERSERIKQVERKLMQAEKLAAIGFLSAGVAHEINNPISIVVTRLELIEKAIEKGDMETVRKDLGVLRSHSARIGRIAGNLLTFSRSGSGEPGQVDLNDIVRVVADLIEYPAKKKGMDIVVDLEPGLPFVWANASGIEQVIYNIAYNAYQASSSGQKIEITTRSAGGGKVKLEIKDRGHGIPKEKVKRVFEPFFTTKEVGQGTGLGLSISYGLVKGFGGSIEVDSDPDTGTVFTVTLDTGSKMLSENNKGLISADV